MATSTFEQYYDANPVSAWDRNTNAWWDPSIDVMFRQSSVFTPLVEWVAMPNGAPSATTGRQGIQGHVNHNPIGLRQKFIDAAYFDSRERTIVSDKRYGAKVQFDKYDPIVNMWSNGGRKGFINGIFNQHLAGSILATHEKLARDAMHANANIKRYSGSGTNFATLAATSDFKFDITSLRDIKLRMSWRLQTSSLRTAGTYAHPVPGSLDMLVLTTPGVIFDLWDMLDADFVQDLKTLQDPRILNGGAIRYQGFTFVETWDSALFNAGALSKQVAVTSPITAGDGAPATTTKVDGVWKVGQDGVTHYVQCTDLGTTQFAVNDVVSIHVARTSDNGVTDGVNPFDGQTILAEVYEVDETNERLKFRLPVMADFNEPFTYTSLNGSAATGTAYAFITKAADVHPLIFTGARGANMFAMRQRVELHTPPAIDDFQSVTRVSWDEYGAMNAWDPDLYEIEYARASFGSRGDVALS